MTAIDISYWQGHPNFPQVKAAGVQLVIMKCGGGEGGKLYTDSVYIANRTAARAQGLPVGSYFFNGPVDPTAAANYQWSVIDWRPGDVVAIDVENSTGLTMWTPAQVLAWVKQMLAHGVPATLILVYMSSSVTALNWAAVRALGVGLWVAQYGTNNGQPQGSPATHGWPWSLWQYTSVATCPGVSGRVDTNQLAPGWPGGGTPIIEGEQDMVAVLLTGAGTEHFAPNQRLLYGPGPITVLGNQQYLPIWQDDPTKPENKIDCSVAELWLIDKGLWEYGPGPDPLTPGPVTGRILGGQSGVDAAGKPIAAYPKVAGGTGGGGAVDLTPVLAAIAALDTQADTYQGQIGVAFQQLPGQVVKATGAALANG